MTRTKVGAGDSKTTREEASRKISFRPAKDLKGSISERRGMPGWRRRRDSSCLFRVGRRSRSGAMVCTVCSAALLAALSGTPQSFAARPIPPSVLPGVGRGAARVMVNANRLPWRGVVLVQTEVGLHCSGALIGTRLVLTAAHCLFGRGTGKLVRPSSIHVLVGYNRGRYVGHARATRFEIGPGFAIGQSQQRLPTAPLDADWAVLTLDAPVGTRDRVLPLAREWPLPDTPAMLGGYEQDRAQVIVADPACVVIGPVRDVGGHVLLHHSCAATRGTSGAPLLVRVHGEGWAVVGIASVAVVGISGGLAVPVSAIPPQALGIAR